MTTAAIIGAGSMGRALHTFLDRAAVDVRLVGRGEEVGTAGVDIVILAVPYAARSEVVRVHRPALDGRVVIDISNPVDFDTHTLLRPEGGSAGAELAAQLPGSAVVKAFNTTYAGHLDTGTVGGRPPTVLIAGDDERATRVTADIVERAGATAVQVGGMVRAAELESLCFLQLSITLVQREWSDAGFVLEGRRVDTATTS